MALYRRAENRNRVSFLGAVLVSLLVLPPLSFAWHGGKIESFSADQVVMSPAGEEISSSRIHVTPDAYRMDGIPGGGMNAEAGTDITVLGFKKQNRQYIYNHSKKLVFESRMDE